MYQQFYGFKSRPFESSSEVNPYFLGQSQRQLNVLVNKGLNTGRGLVVLTGASGSGKSAFIRFFAKEQLNSNYIIARISAVESDDLGLLYLILSGFKQAIINYKTANLFSQIESFVQLQLDQGRWPLLIIDDSDKLNDQSLQVLQQLIQFSDDGKRSFQVLLMGNRNLYDRLSHPVNKTLKDKIVASGELKAMPSSEVKRYVIHRLKQVGWTNNPIISDKVILEALNETGGNPSRINFYFDRFLFREMYRLSGLSNQQLRDDQSGALSNLNGYNFLSSLVQCRDDYLNRFEKTKSAITDNFKFSYEKNLEHKAAFNNRSPVENEAWLNWQTASLVLSSYLLSAVIAGTYFYVEDTDKKFTDKEIVAGIDR